MVHQLQTYLSWTDPTTVVYALVISRLNSCNGGYMGLPLKSVWTLQVVQNVAVCVMAWTQQFDSNGYAGLDPKSTL